MAISSQDQEALEVLDFRVRTILPELYQNSYNEVKPVSMGSAGLKYGQDGKVAWNEMWGSFCDLAMAGGPPHKGTLLEPASKANVDAAPDRYQTVVDEICRGVEMVTDLPAEPSSMPGWISVNCVNRVTAEWLLRATIVENISARSQGTILNLPAGPSYRLEKEIKNVITVMAKTSHYWFGHTPQTQRRNIANLFMAMEQESPLLQPAFSDHDFGAVPRQTLATGMAEIIHRLTGLQTLSDQYLGWVGVEYPSVNSAIWMMRAMIASNALSRREGMVLFVPVDPIRDLNGAYVSRFVLRLHNFAKIQGIV